MALKESNPCECGTVVSRWTTDVKVPSGKSSNPTSGYLFFSQIKAIYYSHRYINTLLITGVGSNPKFATFCLLANWCHLLFCNCRCTLKNIK